MGRLLEQNIRLGGFEQFIEAFAIAAGANEIEKFGFTNYRFKIGEIADRTGGNEDANGILVGQLGLLFWMPVSRRETLGIERFEKDSDLFMDA